MAVESLNHRVAAWLEEIFSLEVDALARLGLSKNGSLVRIVRRLFRLAKYPRARYANKSSTSISKQVENHYYAIGTNVEEHGERVKVPLHPWFAAFLHLHDKVVAFSHRLGTFSTSFAVLAARQTGIRWSIPNTQQSYWINRDLASVTFTQTGRVY